jgi:glycosyltransferase involved in cell wall biosynthesis
LNDFKDKLIFTVISNKPFYPKNFLFLVENEKWLSKNEYRYFMDLDISVMPLNKSMRAQNKSGFKIIQSMACGIPVVASSVGFNKNIIEHGKNGFLADSPFEFYKYLKILILDRQLRLEMGRLAIESIKKFDYKNWEEFYLKQLFN